jgi:hypothetical protein
VYHHTTNRGAGGGEEKREKHLLFSMQEMGAKTQNGGPPTPSFILESWGNTRGQK